jgi:LPXTG-site transpeptidase (sortase) family protein
MSFRTPWLRRIELALWIIGVSLVGVAFASTFDRWNYQQEQQRALFEGAPAVSVAHAVTPAAPAVAVAEKAGAPSNVKQGTAIERVPAPSQPRRTAGEAPSAFGIIEIPSADVSAVVADAADDKTLARAVGRVPGSARPGEVGNMVLAGHRDTFFRGLRNVEINDRISLKVPPHTYEYRVEEVVVVQPHDTGILRSRGREELTLVTCFPFRFVGPAPDRFIVKASRVN